MKYGACERGFIYADVALFTRAWIEISQQRALPLGCLVALFTRAWIEIKFYYTQYSIDTGRPLYEGVD